VTIIFQPKFVLPARAHQFRMTRDFIKLLAVSRSSAPLPENTK
jgi:hypothetical protein